MKGYFLKKSDDKKNKDPASKYQSEGAKNWKRRNKDQTNLEAGIIECQRTCVNEVDKILDSKFRSIERRDSLCELIREL
jgi:hypothetical protein